MPAENQPATGPADIGQLLHFGSIFDEIAPLQKLELLLTLAIEPDDDVDGRTPASRSSMNS